MNVGNIRDECRKVRKEWMQVGKERDECMQVTKEGMQEESKYVGDERVIQVGKERVYLGR